MLDIRFPQIPSWTLALAFILVTSGASAEAPPLLDDLVNTAGFAKSDVSRIGDDVLARELEVSDRGRRAALVAIVRIETDGSGLVGGSGLADRAGRAQGADAFGGFHDPVRPDDVARLRFPDDDMEVLADCYAKQCKFKLSRQGIEDVRAIDWSREDAGDEFTQLFRREALAYVEGYRETGNRALILYADKSTPVSLSSTIESIVGQFEAFRRHAPAFSAYLLSYPEGRLPSMSESILWSIKDFGYRPTLAIAHFVVGREPETKGAVALLAAKTIYANHYLAGRVQMGALLDGAVAFGIPGTFILLVDRIEFDDSLNGFKRSLLVRGLVADIESRMERLRSIADGVR